MRQIAVMLADILYNSGYTVIIDYDQFDAGCRANKENPKPDVFVTLYLTLQQEAVLLSKRSR